MGRAAIVDESGVGSIGNDVANGGGALKREGTVNNYAGRSFCAGTGESQVIVCDRIHCLRTCDGINHRRASAIGCECAGA